MSAHHFELSHEDRQTYIEQIVQVGLMALQSRARSGAKESESATRKEAEQVVQSTYESSANSQELTLKINKMIKKLDPYTAVNIFLHNRALLVRLNLLDHPLLRRDKAVVQSLINRGKDPKVLAQAMEEVLKANALAKAYKNHEADVLHTLAPVAEKLQWALYGDFEQLLRICAAEIPKIVNGLNELALSPAIKSMIHAFADKLPNANTNLMSISREAASIATMKDHCESLVRLAITLAASSREMTESQDFCAQGIPSIVTGSISFSPLFNVGVV